MSEGVGMKERPKSTNWMASLLRGLEVRFTVKGEQKIDAGEGELV